MIISKGAKEIISKLIENGFEAYAVGGSVRDFYLGKKSFDYDVTTIATPDEMLEVFKDYKTYPTGIKHGTITINACNEMVEVTTFRAEKEYSDNRRPDSVEFIKNLNEDLKRRDFTINAMAYNDIVGLVDPFLGIKDLNDKIIRAVGVPEERFTEDALRILRALRFSSVLDFEIEEETEKAILKTKDLLKNVSVERVYSELVKILMGDGVERVLLKYKEVIFTIIPELKESDEFLQLSKYHSYDVYTHIVKSIALSEKDKTVRLALLLHDIGKPKKFTIDKEGVGHFYGHQKLSADMSVKILKKLKVDNNTINNVYKLILLHDTKTDLTRAEVKRFLRSHGFEFLKLLVMVKNGDALAHNEKYIENRLVSTNNMYNTAVDVLDKKECYLLKDLKIDGNDLKKAGYEGHKIKSKLEKILDDVIELKIKNDREILLKEITK